MPTDPSKPDSNSSPQAYPTPEQVRENFQRWRNAMEISHAMLMAGLRDRAGPNGDIQQAYREWNASRRASKLRAWEAAAVRWRNRNQQTNTKRGQKQDAS